MKVKPCVLTIAGTDPSGGAGIQADIKTISATGSYAASVITALVAQNTQGVQAIQAIPAAFVETQLASVFDDLNIAAVKIGMLHDNTIIEVIARALKKYQPAFVVIDPVMIAKNGSALLSLDKINYLKKNLLSYANLMTPNIFEAEQLANVAIHNQETMQQVAIKLGQQFATNVLLKGGHLQQSTAADVLYIHQQNNTHWFYADRIQTKNTHGTGCTLSSAIASYYAQQFSLCDAIRLAKNFLTNAIESGSKQMIGKGNGPVDHFYFMSEADVAY